MRSQISRREFVKSAGALGAVLLGCGQAQPGAAQPARAEVVVFSKICQELKLNFEEVAALTAEAGLDGLDCPVRPGGEVLPENAAADLPRYAGALEKFRLKMPLITTAITGTDSPHAERILATAQKLGVRWYRLGAEMRQTGDSASRQLAEARARLQRLGELNRSIGIGAIFQNHSPSGRSYLGGDLGDLFEIVRDLDPAQVGVAFDLGHAFIVHGEKWREHFDRLRSHIRVVYVKDVDRDRKWVRFGRGIFAQSGLFGLLREIGYAAPFSLHIEFDWDKGGKARTRESLLSALRESTEVLRGWAAAAR